MAAAANKALRKSVVAIIDDLRLDCWLCPGGKTPNQHLGPELFSYLLSALVEGGGAARPAECGPYIPITSYVECLGYFLFWLFHAHFHLRFRVFLA